MLDKAITGFARGDGDEQTLQRGLTEYLAVAYQAQLVLVAKRDAVDGTGGWT